jgi:hypothetical protein
MKIYGIGSTWTEVDKTPEFIKDNNAIIGWRSEDAPALQVLAERISIGDIIYIKSFIQKGSILRIKAIGKVTNYPRMKTNGEELLRVIPVDWFDISENPINHSLSSAEYKYSIYSLTIYEELNHTIISKILECYYTRMQVW